MIFKMTVLHAQESDFNNFWCSVKVVVSTLLMYTFEIADVDFEIWSDLIGRM